MRYNNCMSSEVLSDASIEQEVTKLHVGWTHIPGEGLVRVFETANFAEGLALVNQISQIVLRLNHAPEIILRVDEVDVTTFTPDAGGVTQKDIDLAKAIDDLS